MYCTATSTLWLTNGAIGNIFFTSCVFLCYIPAIESWSAFICNKCKTSLHPFCVWNQWYHQIYLSISTNVPQFITKRIISPHIVLIFLPCVVMLHIITCYSFIERIQCSIFLLLSTNLIKKQNQQCVHFLKQEGAAGFSKHYSKRVNSASFRNYFSCRFGYTSGYLWKHLE